MVGETPHDMHRDGAICLLLAARHAMLVHCTPDKKRHAHRERKEEAAKHNQIIDAEENGHRRAADNEVAQQDNHKPRHPAQDDALAHVDKPVEQQISKKEHDEEEHELIEPYDGE